MVEILRDVNAIKVGYFKSILTEAGIPCLVRNETLSFTEIPIPAFYPALCVMNEEDEDRAREILSEHNEFDVVSAVEMVKPGAGNIVCPKCEEENPANFTSCWSCQADLSDV